MLFGTDGLINGFSQQQSETRPRAPVIYDGDIPPSAPVVVDHGTFSRAFVLDCHAKAKEHGVIYVDGAHARPKLLATATLSLTATLVPSTAPVSGGPVGAAAGTLTVMLGGDERVCERLRPLLHCYAPKVLCCGCVNLPKAPPP